MRETYPARIDLDVTASDLAESWINGNRNHVIDILKIDHPGLVALLLTQHGPMCDGPLTGGDVRIRYHATEKETNNRREACKRQAAFVPIDVLTT